jgi:hypothetical protein
MTKKRLDPETIAALFDQVGDPDRIENAVRREAARQRAAKDRIKQQAAEARAIRKLCFEVIEMGYRALATKLKGVDRSRLRASRDKLNALLKLK